MKNISAVVCDWAGTMVDYGCLAPTLVFVEVFSSFGIEISKVEARGPMGLAKYDHVREILYSERVKKLWSELHLKFPDETDVENIYSHLEPAMESVISRFASPIPGAVEFLNYMRENDIKVGSSTGYVRTMMDKLIPVAESFGLKPDSVVCANDVPAGRPYPWMVYKNMENLSTFPTHKIVKIGDTMADIQEGLNAGTWVVAVTKSGNELGMSLDEIENSPVDIVESKVKAAKEKFKKAGAHFVVDGIWDCMPVLNEIDEMIEKGAKP
jgi:phosphonoacetaldehyde hydrolase